MSIGDHRLYLYADTIDLVLTSGSLYVDNRPMNIRKLNAHKGLTNTINFTVRDRDRRLQDVDVANNLVRAYLTSTIDSVRLVTKTLTAGANVGQLVLTLTEGDLRNIEPGLYSMYVTYTDADCEDQPLYADQNNNVRFDLEVTDQTNSAPPETQVESTFFQVTSTSQGELVNTFVTSAITGNQMGNFINSQHSMAIYPRTFTGNIYIQGSCLGSTPNQDDTINWDWFNIQTIGLSNSSMVQFVTFVMNANWLRVKYIPDDNVSSITQVLVRN